MLLWAGNSSYEATIGLIQAIYYIWCNWTKYERLRVARYAAWFLQNAAYLGVHISLDKLEFSPRTEAEADM